MKRRIIYTIFFILILLGVLNRKLLYYGYIQAKGQLHVVMNAEPIEEVLKDIEFPDSLKRKLELVKEVKRFAFDSLGINYSENYSTIFDQKGKPLLWVVTACDPFELKAKEWSFSFIGSFPYKGFFDHDKAVEEEAIWKEQGLDTNIRTAGGWSTLGWFKDPILSNMLLRKEGDLASLIIHELTHGTLFVKDSVQFNENLATFIGDKGAEKFIAMKFGLDSDEYKTFIQGLEDQHKFKNHILSGAKKLDSLYNAFSEIHSNTFKLEKKQEMITSIIGTIDTLNLHRQEAYNNYYKDFSPNNTYFMSFLRYNDKLDILEEELNENFNGDLKNYLIYLKKKYPSL
ncbi:aminopeptidase [Fulvivirgaceae bacterium BMA10]|uniref:Aminopeptidase n=1 Tax=Splendidivirga corallicola TaxID=3051826 RepID=A0ABT8KJZ9_9BACT|nr:aminopeptidase [Fulvivirgaceae bacterium BMA10]